MAEPPARDGYASGPITDREALEKLVDDDPGSVEALRALHSVLRKDGDHAALLDNLRRELPLAKDPQRQVLLHLEIGQVSADEGATADAMQAFNSALELDPNSDAAVTGLSDVCREEKQWGQLAKALRDLPRTPLITQHLGAALEGLEKWDELVALRQAEFDKMPFGTEHGEAAQALAKLYQQHTNDPARALAAYNTALLGDPSLRILFTEHEQLCYDQKAWRPLMAVYKAAIKHVEAGESRTYRLTDLYTRCGQLQSQYLGQPGEATSSFMKVIELDPDSRDALAFLETICGEHNDWNGLIRIYEQCANATQSDVGRVEMLRRAADVAQNKLDDAEAAAKFNHAVVASGGGETEAQETLQQRYEDSGEWEKAVEVLTSRLASAVADNVAIGFHKRIAQICEDRLSDETRATEHYHKILLIDAADRTALDSLARIYESTERWVEFVKITRRQIKVTTERNIKALLYFKCGSVMESKFDKQDEAIRYYDAAIKTSHSCMPAVHGLRDLYLRRKDYARVIQTLEIEVKLWQDDKERAGVLARIGQIHGENMQEPDRAVHFFESALSVDPECMPANRALFEHHYASEEWLAAAPYAQALARKAMREGDPNERSDFYRKRGIVCRYAGELAQAAESAIIALEIRPDNLAALDDLGALADAEPQCYEFAATYGELEKIYRKREDADLHLARVLVARARMVQRAGDLHAAEAGYVQAIKLAPEDLDVLNALIELHVNTRQWQRAADQVREFLGRDPKPSEDARIAVLFRLGEIYGDGAVDADSAAATFRELLEIKPDHQEALFKLAQELYVAGRFADAKAHVERVIELASAPGSTISAEALSPFYYYLGRIAAKEGDDRSAGRHYHRAAEYDPAYGPPALALAKRAGDSGKHELAETLLVEAARAAMERNDTDTAVSLQRGLARVLLKAEEPDAAIDAYRGILTVAPNSSDDRLALAEIYAQNDLDRAIDEIYVVLGHDLRQAEAYRMASKLFEQKGQQERSVRMQTILDLLGYSDEGELDQTMTLDAQRLDGFCSLAGTLTDDLRGRLLLPDQAKSPLVQLFQLIAEPITALYMLPPVGENLRPFQETGDADFGRAVEDTVRLFNISPEIFVGDDVIGGMVVLQFPRPCITLDKTFFGQPDLERRFLLGRAFDSLRGGYASLMRFSEREQAEVAGLLGTMLLPAEERPRPAQEFIAHLPENAARDIDNYVGTELSTTPEEWIRALKRSQDRAGLLSCNDFGVAARTLAKLSGEELATTDDGVLAIGAVPGGSELVRFFLSQQYHDLYQTLTHNP